MKKTKKTSKTSKGSDTQERIQELEAANEVLNGKLLRVLADYQNLQKQTATQVEAMRISSIQQVLLKISDAIDEFDLAIETIGDKVDLGGLKNIREKLSSAIVEQGCEVIKPENGDDYIPETMEVISEVDTGNDKESERLSGKVAQTVSAGIIYEKKVLKPARVITYKSN